MSAGGMHAECRTVIACVHATASLQHTGYEDHKAGSGRSVTRSPCLTVSACLTVSPSLTVPPCLHTIKQNPWTGSGTSSVYPHEWFEVYNGSTPINMAENWAIYEDEVTGDAVGLMVPMSVEASAFR